MSEPSVCPQTVEEAVERLIATLSVEEKCNLRDSSDDDLVCFHFGLGLFIRNAFGLNSGNNALLAACARTDGNNLPYLPDPDSATMVIMEALVRRLRKETSGH